MKTNERAVPSTGAKGMDRPFRTIWLLAFPIILSNITVPLLLLGLWIFTPKHNGACRPSVGG